MQASTSARGRPLRIRSVIVSGLIGLTAAALGAPALVHAQTGGSTAAPLPPSSREWERILPVASDFAADAREARAAGKPILLFFSLTGCAFCRGALREVIVPMYRDPKWNSRMLFRQITIDHTTPLTDFDGKSVRPIDVATRLDGRFTPTVMMLDPDGRKIGEAVVGIANFDFYASYVETMANRALDEMARRGKR